MPIADELGCTLAQLALAWCLKNPHVSTVITGASRPAQVVENMKALAVVPKLTPDVMRDAHRAAPTAASAASSTEPMNPLECWTEEQRSAFLYRACADAETGTVRAELFRRLAGEAEAQAAIWRAQLTARGPSGARPVRARRAHAPRRAPGAVARAAAAARTCWRR